MADIAPVAFKKRTNKGANIRKRPATPPPDASDSDEYTSEEENGHRIKRRRKEGVPVTSTAPKHVDAVEKHNTAFSADRSSKLSATNDATKTSNWEHGGAKPSGHLGPQKAQGNNVRMVITTDFAPDVCKDYKQTGFCGFGDSCKFLHAREDYKQGWQLDREWEKVGKNKDKPAANNDDRDEEEKMLEGIPFKCIICKEDYKRPVITKCGHYFCEKCAMTRYMKERKKGCANCGVDTGGTFNMAKKLNELLERKKTREKEREEKENGAPEDG
ncbi:Pre-mRNA-splicing factor cwc24 [Teratosphaeria destructans]|uniref:Pre-mRNA-splicing factor CWC24 n=1 Tax=Teratosphaeria destructans TaxID=418781 RepID=A0A9W7W6V5_9PEZI|nr:Pre-mRNA-splicing factor cwc24 [Teratosphaeria destructans]